MKAKSRPSRSKSPELPLSRIAVLDLTRILSGPFCTMKLGDMGAEVIKIEQPGNGDETRKWGPPFIKGESAYFLSVNRNKKSVTLDLKSEEGKEILIKLIKRSDVLVENFRAGVMKSLGFDYPIVRLINPRIVYCSISGYGQTTSRSHRPSYDLIIQGESGLMDLTGFPGGVPTKTGISLADVNAGNIAFEGILLALFQRERTGKGEYIDISLLDSMASLLTYQSQMALSTNQRPKRLGNRHPTITPYETFATRDGFVNIAIAGEVSWKSFCKVLGKSALATDKRFRSNALRVEHRAELEKILVPLLKKKRTALLLREFSTADVPIGKILTVAEMLAHPAIGERKMIAAVAHPRAGTIKMVGNPIRLSGSSTVKILPPPILSQHTMGTLKGLGYTSSQIATLKRQSVI